MLKNYLKCGWRNFIKYKSYSIINIFGLSIGFASTLLLFLIIEYENSFDDLHSNLDKIYRVGNSYTTGGFDEMVVTPQIPLMEKEYADIIHATRFHALHDIIAKEDHYVQISAHLVDPGFAAMFDFKMLNGNLTGALSSPNQIVLTRSLAVRLFGNLSAIGKSISFVNEKLDFTVAAIIEDPPKNSTLQFESLVPWVNAPEWLDVTQSGNWYNTFMEGYIQIAPQTSKEALEKKLVAFKDKYFLEERRPTWNVCLLPMADEHFRITKNKQLITILSMIAGAILLISCFNYANMSVAQTMRRTREVGVRRVLGGLKRQLTAQFMTESLITCIVSILAAVVITLFSLPYVNRYYDFGVTLALRHDQSILIFLFSVCLLICCFSTLAPSLALSTVNPVNTMKGAIKANKPAQYIRKGLVVVQFMASAILLIGTLVVWQQTHHMKSYDLKLDHNNVVAIPTDAGRFRDADKAKQMFFTLRKELQNATTIESATFTSGIPGEYNENYNSFLLVDSKQNKRASLRKLYIDEHFFETFTIKIIMGRGFSPELESDKQAVIINETALKEFGGVNLNNFEILEGGNADGRLHVIGVVEDYHYQSLQRSIQPLIHFYNPNSINHLAVKLKPDRIQEGLSFLKTQWDALGPYEPFAFKFVDESFDSLYKEQERLAATSSLFSLIAISIAGLGLFSVTAYSVRQRRKEVSIRKVLGASVLSITVQLSKGYIMLIVIGFMLACPIIYHLANSFLDNFAYKIKLSPLLFGAVGVAIFTLAMLIVYVLSGRAALENPVNALKEE
jgi:putative ABC transport system permease protein